jgi:hypothetical protein
MKIVSVIFATDPDAKSQYEKNIILYSEWKSQIITLIGLIKNNPSIGLKIGFLSKDEDAFVQGKNIHPLTRDDRYKQAGAIAADLVSAGDIDRPKNRLVYAVKEIVDDFHFMKVVTSNVSFLYKPIRNFPDLSQIKSGQYGYIVIIEVGGHYNSIPKDGAIQHASVLASNILMSSSMHLVSIRFMGETVCNSKGVPLLFETGEELRDYVEEVVVHNLDDFTVNGTPLREVENHGFSVNNFDSQIAGVPHQGEVIHYSRKSPRKVVQHSVPVQNPSRVSVRRVASDIARRLGLRCTKSGEADEDDDYGIEFWLHPRRVDQQNFPKVLPEVERMWKQKYGHNGVVELINDDSGVYISVYVDYIHLA